MVRYAARGRADGCLLPLLWITLSHRPILPGTVRPPRLVAQAGAEDAPRPSRLKPQTNRDQCSQSTLSTVPALVRSQATPSGAPFG